MGVTRRDFLKISGGGIAAAAVAGDAVAEGRRGEHLRTLNTVKTTTICPYCSVGCGLVVSTVPGEIINAEVVSIEGDHEHPINRGALCAKGSSILQLRQNPQRVTKPLYRAPGGTEWEEVSWDWAVERIAERVKKTRDESFETVNPAGQVVNRTTAMASVGSAALDNEECYLYQKFLRGLGLVYIEHQARL